VHWCWDQSWMFPEPGMDGLRQGQYDELELKVKVGTQTYRP